jgi:NADH-quinone oxidoreductase subunit I
MAITENRELRQARTPGFGIGLLKGMAVTLKHLFKRNVVIEYPDEKQDLPPRTRGVIALKEENCTVCMLCARECPDWCIYIDSHKETLPPKREGGRQRKRNVLDRFAIDYALCMYCGICVEVCPYDALFWSREFEYAEYDIRELTHEKERLSDWMATVLPPPPLEEGAEIPGQVARATPTATAPTPAPSAQPRPQQTPTPQATTTPETVAATGAAPSTVTSSAAETRPEQAAVAPKEGSFTTTPERPVDTLPEGERAAATDVANATPEPARGLEDEVKQQTGVETATTEGTEDVPAQAGATETGAPPAQESAPTDQAEPATEATVQVPHEEPRPTPLEQTEDPEEVYRQVLEEQRSKGASPQVAEARAKVARVKTERGIRRAAGATPAPEVQPQAPDPGHATEPEPSGAPEARDIQPDPGPVAPVSRSEAETLPEEEAVEDRRAEAAAKGEDAERAVQGAATPTTDAAETLERQEVASAPAAPVAEVRRDEARHEEERAGEAPEREPSEQSTVQATGETYGDQETSPAGTPSAAATEAEERTEPQARVEPEQRAADAPQQQATEDPEVVYQSVLEAEREKGSSEAVAVARAKAARARAQRGMRRPRT